MARPIIEEGAGFIREIFPTNPDPRGLLTGAMFQNVRRVFQALLSRVNGRLSLGSTTDAARSGNLDAQYRVVVTPSVANTEFLVDHGLGRVPVGYIVVDRDAAAHVYSSLRTTWTSTVLKLKCSGTSVTIRIMVF